MTEALAKNLSDLWGRPGHQKMFPVSAPMKLTEWTGSGFHKKSFIGEEMMRPIGAYVGKKGGMILKFREEDMDSTVHIEMTVAEAQTNLEGFSTHYNNVLDNLEDFLMAETREAAAAKEEAADMEARRASDPIFGSWS